jgi:enediyne biosynthesis protein E3
MIFGTGPLRKWVLGLDLGTLDFGALGFHEQGEARSRLEHVSRTVVEGYNAAVETGYGRILIERMNMVGKELQGFFAEGIAMGLFTWDRVPGTHGNHLSRFLAAEGRDHAYMAFIGAGLATALFHLDPAKHVRSFDPLSGPLLYDGYGFYHAYFHPRKTFGEARVPRAIAANAFLRARFDGGAGRALWFYAGGDVQRIAQVVGKMPEARHGDLWAGVGLASTYAGGVSRQSLAQLLDAAGKHRIRLALGSSLAVHARHKAGNPHEDDFACRLFTGRSSLEVHEQCERLALPLLGKASVDGAPALGAWTRGVEQWLDGIRNLSVTEAL